MASIKERAAALNLAEKLSVRPQVHSEALKPGRSTSSYSGLISHLRASLQIKRRRVHLRSYNDCFLGSEAVDAVAEHLSREQGATTSREKVVLVCQALLDCSVFEAVGTKVFGKDKKLDVFQDSKSALYRFINIHTPSVDELETGLLRNRIKTLSSDAPSDRQDELAVPTGSHGLKTTQVNFTHVPINTHATASLSQETVVDNMSLSPGKVQTDSVLPQSLVDTVWQEQSLLMLLNLVEVPILEGVLQCCQNPSSSPPSHSLAHSNPDLIYCSNHLDRKILKAFRDSHSQDEWLCAALDCLDFLPDQPVVNVSRELPYCFPQEEQSSETNDNSTADGVLHNDQSGLIQCKLLLYGALVKHYSATDRLPLLPQRLSDIYIAINDLLVTAKLSSALEALQLFVKLLPPNCREELRSLLTFMAVAADTNAIKLDKEMENRVAVKASFSRAIFPSKALSKEKEELMVVFMLSNVKEIFKVPEALHKRVSDKLANLVQGRQPDVTDCQVSNKTYTASAKNTTNQELWALLNNIHLDTKISAKERKRLLGQFYQAHPEIFNKFFGESAVSAL